MIQYAAMDLLSKASSHISSDQAGSDSATAWVELLDEKKQNFVNSLGVETYEDTRITDNKSFRNAFETLCKSLKEYKPQQLLAHLLPSFASINNLTHGVTESNGELQRHKGSCSLEGLMYRATFVLIAVCHPRCHCDCC